MTASVETIATDLAWLLLDAAFRLDSRELVGLIRPVLLLALPGTLLTAAVVGGVVWWLLGIPIAVALLFGGVVAPTDPVAVVAVFRRLRVGKRLTVVLEAESLFNDGVALALYGALSTFAITGATQVGTSVARFLWEV